MAIQNREAFVKKTTTCIEAGIMTHEIIQILTRTHSESGTGASWGLPYALKKAQANNMVKSVRKQMGVYCPLGYVTNWDSKRIMAEHTQRVKEMQKDFNKSAAVIQENHKKPSL